LLQAIRHRITNVLLLLRPQRWMASVVLLLGIGLSLLGWQTSVERTHALAGSRFEARAQEMRGAIQARIFAYAQALHGIQGFVAASGHPDRDQWLHIYHSLDIEKHFPGIVGIVYYRVFDQTERAAVEAETRRFEPAFNIRPAGERADYAVVTAVAPRRPSDLGIIGSDSYASPVRRQTIEAARDSGEIRITRKLTLAIDDPGRPRPGFLMFKAIYRDGMIPATVAERRTRLLGLVNGGFRMDTLMQGIFGNLPQDVALRIYDGQSSNANDLYYASHPDFDFSGAGYRQQMAVEALGQSWRVEFASLPPFDDEIGSHSYAWKLLAAGLVVSLLLFSVIWALARTRAMADGLAKQMTRSLQESEIKMRALFEQAPIGIMMFDGEGRIIDCNDKCLEYSDASRENLIGLRMFEEARDTSLNASIRRAIDGEVVEHEGVYTTTSGGRSSYFKYYFQPVQIDAQLAFVLGFFEDISARKAAEASIEHLAHHDALTGLANRTLLKDRMQQAIANAARNGNQLALLFVDLDFFKNINDTVSHAAGDKVLVEIANRLSACLRGSDTLARVGGDEFIVLLTNLHSASQTIPIAQGMLDQVAVSLPLDGLIFDLTASIGIAIWPEDGEDGDTLTRNADVAMYHAKRNGRSNYQFFKAEMNARMLEMVAMERSLRDAMLKEQFRLHYQGQVDGESGAITGAEALIRWQHPEFGLLGPGRFIEVAEERGMIEPIGEWVLRTACMQAKAWLDAGHQLRIAVNVSPIQLRKGRLLDSVLMALHDSGLPPANLALEITESAVMEDVEAGAEMLRCLHELGIQIEIDDFGTGHSSLAYLKQLPIERLKIDQSFVRAVPGDADGEAIVDAIIGLATSLRLEIIAEGVETEAQRLFLLERGCRAMQGFHFCRPQPPAEFEELLKTAPQLTSSSTATEQL